MATTLPATVPDFLISNNYRPATDPTTLNHYVSRAGGADNVGEIPVSEYLRKIESTPIFESEDRLNEHFRRTLKDRTPEAPTIASDLTRRDRHSTEILSVRHNMSRSAEEPFHPDLNLSFTERDPRGIATEPNSRKLALQGGYRMKYKDFVNDNLSDASITSGHRSNETVIKDFRATINPAKTRWKWFGTSRDGRANRTNMASFSTERRSDASKVIFNQPNLRVNEASQATRDAVTKISNALPIGSRSTASHRFDIADYSQVRGSKHIGNNDFRKLMDVAEEDQDADESKEESTRAIAYIMSTAANKEVEFDAEKTESFNAQDRHTGVQVMDVRKAFDSTDCSASNPGGAILQHYLQKPQSRTTVCNDRLGNLGELDKAQMALIKEMKNNRSMSFHFDPHIAWDTEKDQTAARTHKTYVYKNAATIMTNRIGADEFDQTQDMTQSAYTQDRATSHVMLAPGGSRDVDATAASTDSQFKNRHGGGLGQKSKAKYYGDTDSRGTGMGDMESMSRRSSHTGARGTATALKHTRL